MIINRLLGLVPERYKSYQYLSQYIPSKYRVDIDRIVRQLKPELFQESDEPIEADVLNVAGTQSLNNEDTEKKRQNLVKNFSNEEGQFPRGYTDESHEQSLKDHEAESAFSSSPVNGAGNVGGKFNSNMSHRNYQ